MSADLTPANGNSPFDRIRRSRPDGSEYWSARELMPLMGYGQWRDFQTAVERAKIAARNSGEDLTRLFVPVRKNSGGRPQEDYELARFAAYLVALNGDPRKPETASAQAYFVVRTREAEVSGRHRAELLTRSDLARMVLEAEEEKSVLCAALESAAPAIAYHDRYVANGDAATVKVWGAQFGLTQPEAFALLVDKKLIYRVSLGERWSESEQQKITEHEYRAYAKHIEWFDLRPQHNAPRHHNGQVRQTLYIRQQFALEIAGKCGLPMQLSLPGGEHA